MSSINCFSSSSFFFSNLPLPSSSHLFLRLFTLRPRPPAATKLPTRSDIAQQLTTAAATFPLPPPLPPSARLYPPPLKNCVQHVSHRYYLSQISSIQHILKIDILNVTDGRSGVLDHGKKSRRCGRFLSLERRSARRRRRRTPRRRRRRERRRNTLHLFAEQRRRLLLLLLFRSSSSSSSSSNVGRIAAVAAVASARCFRIFRGCWKDVIGC